MQVRMDKIGDIMYKPKKVKKNSKMRKDRQKQVYMQRGIILLISLMIILGGIKLLFPGFLGGSKYSELDDSKITTDKPDIDVQLLSVNPYSRPGGETGKIKGIVVHYTANPGASAQDNRDYFEGLKSSHTTKASSNFIVGLDGEIIQCVPTWEIAYASNNRNKDTVSIECCHPDESGKFNKETYGSMVQLTAWLCEKFGLSEKDVIRHYDVTGKDCPKYFVENEEAWDEFRAIIREAMSK